jgi:hypothetical protein
VYADSLAQEVRPDPADTQMSLTEGSFLVIPVVTKGEPGRNDLRLDAVDPALSVGLWIYRVEQKGVVGASHMISTVLHH